MPTFNSIAPIQKYYTTLGSAPVLVLCNDLKQYVCKYADRETSALVREYVASRFLQIWEIPTPNIAWVHIKQTDNWDKNLIVDKYFQKTCFGSEFLPDVIDVDFSANIPITNIVHFIHISLFDIWVCHCDRTQNNANLLLTKDTRFRFIAIDHSSIFDNGNEYGADLPIMVANSLLTTTYFEKHYPPNHAASKRAFSIIKQDFEDKIKACKAQIDTIFDEIPNEICKENDKIERKIWLKTVLCADDRIASVWQAVEIYLTSKF